MEVKGIVTKVLEMRQGVSKIGNEWKSQEFIVSYGSIEYPKKIILSMRNDKIVELHEGYRVEVKFSTDVNEYNGRFYGQNDAWDIKVNSTTQNGVNDII